LKGIKTIRMRWTGHVACTEKRSDVYGVFVENLREKAHLEDSGMDGKIILRSIFRKWNGGTWTGLIWLRIGTGVEHL
jgi:hypothetical protein